ncbi:MAG: hypothetical protein N2322_01420 [Terrimicrobiaceae bacterium]|nr:hypothetical protein [Terrimicrobiaceae bacterium]
MAAGRPFFVLNPGGRDPDQDFPDGPGNPAARGHPPVNFHAYAACMRGGFRGEAAGIPAGAGVLVLLRARHLPRALAACQRLRQAGCKVFAAWKEAGFPQVQESLAATGRWAVFCRIAEEADGALSPTQDLLPLYEAAGFAKVVFLPTPYPLEEPAWDFSIPLARREGVFVGTREFDSPTRNHRAALALAASLPPPLTVIHAGGWREKQAIRELAPHARLVKGPLPYPDYLRLMAGARVVFQLDASRVPGQVAGDALLCRMPCAGGDSAIERIAFPTLSGWGREPSEVLASIRRLLADDAAWEAAVRDARARAMPCLSFSAAQGKLRELLA